MKKYAAIFLLLLLSIACKNTPQEFCEEEKTDDLPVFTEAYGFVLDHFHVVKDTVKPGDTFGKLMDDMGVSAAKVFQIAEYAKDTFDVRQLRAGKPYTVLKSKDSANQPNVFIYHPNKIDYVVIDIRDSIVCYRDKLPVTTKRKTASGIINSSLSQAMTEEGLSQALVYELSSIYQWSVDFFRLQKGDHFKIIYNENYINDTIYAGIENVEATILNHNNKPYYAFRFVTDSIAGTADYYDEQANTLRNFFLKAPLNYTRISSRYSLKRFHPVQKKWKAHLGTDYAAPHGTPIMATANGTVERSGYNSGNGNYVKIKHNNTYSTQYLHMSKRAVKVGDRVKQGDIIGYVGSTGLATGPHVCYRFWYNGKQVDPYAIDLPAAEPIKEELKESYFSYIESLKQEIDQIDKDEEYVLR